jgi:hypothetical protein
MATKKFKMESGTQQNQQVDDNRTQKLVNIKKKQITPVDHFYFDIVGTFYY